MSDHDEKYYRAKWMSDDQWQCAKMFADVCRGFHHVNGTFKEFGSGVAIHTSLSGWATWDYDNLTRLVVMAHDRMIRVDLLHSGSRMYGFALWKRHTRDGDMSKRHPTIEDAVSMCRQGYGK